VLNKIRGGFDGVCILPICACFFWGMEYLLDAKTLSKGSFSFLWLPSDQVLIIVIL